ncbi:MAG TPA: hypothetical protein PKU93_00380 [Candidatus Pacearchaeota archaeon]|nr:hypothetical protein [Candidatus Pacearchaeota archaeon]
MLIKPKTQKETSQSLVYRFTQAIKKSGILVEARKRQFNERKLSKNILKRKAVIREEKKKEYLRNKKLGK